GAVVVGPLLVQTTFFHHLGHGVGVCGGEHVGGCPGGDLYGQLTAAGEVEGHLDTGMLGLELLGEFFEDVQKGCCGKDDEFSLRGVLPRGGLPCRTGGGHQNQCQGHRDRLWYCRVRVGGALTHGVLLGSG